MAIIPAKSEKIGQLLNEGRRDRAGSDRRISIRVAQNSLPAWDHLPRRPAKPGRGCHSRPHPAEHPGSGDGRFEGKAIGQQPSHGGLAWIRSSKDFSATPPSLAAVATSCCSSGRERILC
ncbi:hypothetical protein [Neorhizobium sp. DT-125]|uniref:hypothetical protein n=1 Tax=Neorhizobium sp. DT-125 TaxID=3396163 RepID=UPI003F19ED6C